MVWLWPHVLKELHTGNVKSALFRIQVGYEQSHLILVARSGHMLSSGLRDSSGYVSTALGYTLVMGKLILTLWIGVASQHDIGFVTVQVTKFSKLHLN